MLISHSKKFIFIHIYKTAGTSVMAIFLPCARLIDRFVYENRYSRAVVRRINRYMGWEDDGNRQFTGFHKHGSAKDVIAKLGKDRFDDYFTFAFVRNPFDFLVSLYFYIRQAKSHRFHSRVTQMEFSEFLHWYISQNPDRQTDFITDEKGDVVIDFVGRFESIEADVKHVCDILSIPFSQLPHKNLSRERKKKDFMEYYNESDKSLVKEYFHDDFDLLEYN